MKISNLHIEDRNDGRSYLVADVECGFSESNTLWFSVDSHYREWLTTDVYDAFFVTALYPAQFYGEKIEIEGEVSPHLYYNILNYVPAIISDYNGTERLQKSDIKVKGTRVPSQQQGARIGTGFSGGIDSFSTIIEHLINEKDPARKLTTLFFFNIGQNGRLNDPYLKDRISARWKIASEVAHELNLEAVMMDSNMFEFYQPHWEYDAGVLCRLASILVFQQNLKRYYLSSACSFGESYRFGGSNKHIDMTTMCELYLSGMLSSEICEIILDGAQHTRSEKTRLIVDFPIAQRYLNVCVNYDPEYISHNCGHCSKCLRTAFTLEALGKLESFKNVFDVAKIRKAIPHYMYYLVDNYDLDAYAHDNVDLARKQGIRVPTKYQVKFYKATQYTKEFSYKVLHKLHLK